VALLAAVAIAGTVEATTPDLASAQKPRGTYCDGLLDEMIYWGEVGLREEVERVRDQYERMCLTADQEV
jgi:hypothetical protein